MANVPKRNRDNFIPTNLLFVILWLMYLRGIETIISLFIVTRYKMWLMYLRGIETFYEIIDGTFDVRWLMYLRGIETKRLLTNSNKPSIVANVPKRNRDLSTIY